MAFTMTCPPCAEGRCEDHIAHAGPEGVIGGVSCPCRHTPEDQRRNAEARERWRRDLLAKLEGRPHEP